MPALRHSFVVHALKANSTAYSDCETNQSDMKTKNPYSVESGLRTEK